MGLNNIVKSRGFRNFMAKLYGWGASLVILGALFKINHYQGADIMLVLGLTTEAVIFFFSAFEPPHVEPDWSLVYPELAGMYHRMENGDELETADGRVAIGSSGSITGELDKMLEEAHISPDLIQNLGQGLRSLSDSTSRLGDITNATVATNEYASNVKSASEAVNRLSQSYVKTKDVLDKDAVASEEYSSSLRNASSSASGLSGAYNQVADAIKRDIGASGELASSIKSATESVNDLSSKYSKSADIISKSAEALDFSSIKEKNYADQLQKISQNLVSLNTAYEMQLKNSMAQAESATKLKESLDMFLGAISSSVENTGKYKENIDALNRLFEKQLQGTESQVNAVGKLQSGLNEFHAKISESAAKTLKYNEELDNLAQKVASLNTVYGNMLSALNVKSEK